MTPSGIIRRGMDWLGGHVNLVLVAALLAVAGAWGFIALADEVSEGSTQHFDQWAIHRLHVEDPPGSGLYVPIGPPWLREVGRDLTALGGVAVLLLITAAVAGFLLISEKRAAVLLVLAATVGGLALSTALKHLYDRPRPPAAFHSAYTYTTSFPSGHSMMAAVVYLTLGTLLARFAASRRLKIYFLAVALALTFLVGVSRVYMGVHWPTDVLAGWTAGLVWALICWLAARYLQRRGTVEREGE